MSERKKEREIERKKDKERNRLKSPKRPCAPTKTGTVREREKDSNRGKQTGRDK